MRDLLRSVAFASIATFAYAGLTWRHQPVLLNREEPGPVVIEGWMIASLVLAAFATFTCAWGVFLRFSKCRRPWLAGLTGGLAAALVPILHLWVYQLARPLVLAQRAATEPVPPAFAVTFGIMEIILASGLWYAASLVTIAWFTIPLSIGIAILFLLAQEGLALSGTRARSAPPAPR